MPDARPQRTKTEIQDDAIRVWEGMQDEAIRVWEETPTPLYDEFMNGSKTEERFWEYVDKLSKKYPARDVRTIVENSIPGPETVGPSIKSKAALYLNGFKYAEKERVLGAPTLLAFVLNIEAKIQQAKMQQAKGSKPACEWSQPIVGKYLAGRPCKKFKTLAEAQEACIADPKCGGVTGRTTNDPYWDTRAGTDGIRNSPSGEITYTLADAKKCRLPGNAQPQTVIPIQANKKQLPPCDSPDGGRPPCLTQDGAIQYSYAFPAKKLSEEWPNGKVERNEIMRNYNVSELVGGKRKNRKSRQGRKSRKNRATRRN